MMRADLLSELQQFIAEYWASVDRLPDVQRTSASFFTEGGEMVLGSLNVRGRENLETFFKNRTEKELANQRTTRHFTANLRIESTGEHRSTVRALVLVHSGCGEWPLAAAPPSAVGDFTFECLHDPALGWRFEKLRGTSVFVGAGAPSFAKSS